jgi:hypothetical protein
LVDRQVGEVGHHLVALLVGQRVLLLGLPAVQRQRGVLRIPGERVRRKGVWWHGADTTNPDNPRRVNLPTG